MVKRICLADDCEESAYCRGRCTKHYQRWRKSGSDADPRPTPEERFWAKVNKAGPIPSCRPELGPCWTWTGARSSGYGRLGLGSSTVVYAHRYAYELLVRPIPDGLEPDHLCRVRHCVKAIANEQGPAHLEAVTRSENQQRGAGPQVTRERHAAKTHCKRGHPYNEANMLIGTNGERRCRACLRFLARGYYEARRDEINAYKRAWRAARKKQ
jgi:hypothetical protein